MRGSSSVVVYLKVELGAPYNKCSRVCINLCSRAIPWREIGAGVGAGGAAAVLLL